MQGYWRLEVSLRRERVAARGRRGCAGFRGHRRRATNSPFTEDGQGIASRPLPPHSSGVSITKTARKREATWAKSVRGGRMTRIRFAVVRPDSMACLLICTLGLSAAAGAQTITSFDAPGAGTAAGQGTFAFGITPAGLTTGYYVDPSGVSHGFLRAKDGGITSFDAPGAGTVPWSINPDGVITGQYVDATGLSHGFVRTPDGAITSFDAPGAANISPCGPPSSVRPAQKGRASIRRALSQVSTSMPTGYFTVLCASRAAPSPPSMHREPVPGSAKALSSRSATGSIRPVQSRSVCGRGWRLSRFRASA